MARPLIPFVQNGYYASRNWIPLVKGNGFTTSGGGEQEEVWETASGSIVTFNAVAAPLRQLSVAVEPVQNLNGYDNPWPAGCGKNLLNIPSITTLNAHGLTYSVASDGAIKISGTASEETRFEFDTDMPLVAGSYTLKMQGATSDVRWISNGNNGFYYTSRYGDFTRTYTFTGPVTIQYLYLDIANGANVNLILYIQIESGSTATSWSPYSNICPITGFDSVNIWVQPTHDTTATPTATIQLGETVYGGTLDVVNGKMTVTHAIRTFDGTEDWRGPDSSGICWLRDDALKKTTNYEGTIIASTMPTAMTRFCLKNDFECGISGYEISGDDNYWYIKAPNQTTQTNTALKAWLQANNAQACYELATPFELTLTPEQISTLQGVNNVWSDAGNVTVEYRAR